MSRTLCAQLPEPTGAGLIWASAADASGRSYLADEFNHRILVEEPDGRTWSFGSPGSGAGEFRFPRGIAVVQEAAAGETRVFVGDTWNHRVQVFTGSGELVYGFGGEGEGPGQFRMPGGVALATPELPWEGDGALGVSVPMLVVADEWNSRVQVFTLDGVWLATLTSRPRARSEETAGRGWPFFRLADMTIPRDPVRVSWTAPWLTVVGGNGRAHRLDLAAMLLPHFEEWVGTAGDAERAHAYRYFSMSRGGRRALPAAVLSILNSTQALA